MCGVTSEMISPSVRRTSRSTPWVLGCCGPMLTSISSVRTSNSTTVGSAIAAGELESDFHFTQFAMNVGGHAEAIRQPAIVAEPFEQGCGLRCSRRCIAEVLQHVEEGGLLPEAIGQVSFFVWLRSRDAPRRQRVEQVRRKMGDGFSSNGLKRGKVLHPIIRELVENRLASIVLFSLRFVHDLAPFWNTCNDR